MSTPPRTPPPAYQRPGAPAPFQPAPGVASPYAPARQLTIDPRVLWGVGSCVALAIGSVGPWVTAGPFSVSGTAGATDGWVTLVCGVLALVLVAAPAVRSTILPGLLSLVALGVAVYDLSRLTSLDDQSIISVGPGWGILLAAAGAGSLLVYCLLCRRSAVAPAGPAWYATPQGPVPPPYAPGAFGLPDVPDPGFAAPAAAHGVGQPTATRTGDVGPHTAATPTTPLWPEDTARDLAPAPAQTATSAPPAAVPRAATSLDPAPPTPAVARAVVARHGAVPAVTPQTSPLSPYGR